MKRLLIIEDDQEYQFLIRRVLGKDYDLEFGTSLQEAEDLITKSMYDLILLDITLPDGDGFKFLSMIANDNNLKHLPVLCLSGRSEVADQVMGFSLGAEDYIVKPVHPRLLKARVQSKLRKREQMSKETIEIGEIRIQLQKQVAEIQKEENGKWTKLELTPIEFKLLVFFAKNEENVYSREQILNGVWGENLHISDRTVDTHVSHLRSKLRGTTCIIEPVRGAGYRFMIVKKSQKRVASISKTAA